MIIEIDVSEWAKYIENRVEATLFHHKLWLQLLISQYRFRPTIFAHKKNNTIDAALPFLETHTIMGKKKLVSLPFTDYLDIIQTRPEYVREIISFLKKQVLTKYKLIEIRSDLSRYGLANRYSYILHTLPLSDDYESIYHNFKSNIKRNLNKALKSQINIKMSADFSALEAFYKLHLITRKKHGIPTQPRGYFYKLKEYLFDRNYGFIMTAYKDKIPIAASIFLMFNSTLIYKYGASDDRWLSYRPNDMLFAEAIRWACDNGCRLVDFGVSPIENEGLRRFKSGWGADEKPAPYFYLTNNGKIPSGKQGKSKFLQQFIQHSPSWICRGLGESLYRFAG